MRRLVLTFLAACVLVAFAAPDAMACRIGGSLKASGHHPKAGKKWAIVVTASPSITTSAKYEFYFQGQKVSTQYPFYNHHYKFKKRFRDGTIVFPKRAVGYQLTFRVVIHNRCGTKNFNYAIKVRK
jgi:hypothetical protein